MMQSQRNLIPFAGVVGLAILAGMAVSANATQYTLTDTGLVSLGAFKTDADAIAAINNQGKLVTNIKNPTSRTVSAVCYDYSTNTSTVMANAGYSGTATRVYDINDVGQIVGYCKVGDSGGSRPKDFYQGSVWSSPTSTPALLGYVNGALAVPFSAAYSLNAAGQVVGQSNDTSSSKVVYAWETASGIANLGSPEGATDSVARAINDNGRVVGWSAGIKSQNNYNTEFDSFVGTSAFVGVLNSGALIDTVDLGGLRQDFWDTKAYAINGNGQIAGVSASVLVTDEEGFSYFLNHAFIGSVADGVPSLTDLGVLGKGEHESSVAYGINSIGQVVGMDSYDGGTAGFLASVVDGEATMTDLQSLLPEGSGWTIVAGWDINDSGQIVAAATLDSNPGNYHVVVLNAVPEPSTLLLAATMGLAGLLAYGCKKQK